MQSQPCDERSFQRARRTTKSLPRRCHDNQASALADRRFCLATYSHYDRGIILSMSIYSQSVLTVREHCCLSMWLELHEWLTVQLLWMIIIVPERLLCSPGICSCDNVLGWFRNRIWGFHYWLLSTMLRVTIWSIMGYLIPRMISIFPVNRLFQYQFFFRCYDYLWWKSLYEQLVLSSIEYFIIWSSSLYQILSVQLSLWCLLRSIISIRTELHHYVTALSTPLWTSMVVATTFRCTARTTHIVLRLFQWGYIRYLSASERQYVMTVTQISMEPM